MLRSEAALSIQHNGVDVEIGQSASLHGLLYYPVYFIFLIYPSMKLIQHLGS
jgi:hypothetical protein